MVSKKEYEKAKDVILAYEKQQKATVVDDYIKNKYVTYNNWVDIQIRMSQLVRNLNIPAYCYKASNGTCIVTCEKLDGVEIEASLSPELKTGNSTIFGGFREW